MIIALTVIASGVGAVARYVLAGAVLRRTGRRWPWGTTVVNVSGALALGLLTGVHASGRLDPDAFTIVGAGLIGGFTTFSTWMVETVRLGEQGAAAGLLAVAVNGVLLLAVGVGAAAVGMWLG